MDEDTQKLKKLPDLTEKEQKIIENQEKNNSIPLMSQLEVLSSGSEGEEDQIIDKVLWDTYSDNS